MNTLVSSDINNESTFERIFKQYFNPLTYFINSYLHNQEDSKEVVQNTFMKIWANKEQLTIQDSVKGYLFQAAKNTMLDYIRANKKHAQTDEIILTRHESIKEEIQSCLDPYLIKQSIVDAAKHLKPKTLEIFNLWAFEGLTQEEIADHLKIAKRTVEYHTSLAFDHLRNELKNSNIIFDH